MNILNKVINSSEQKTVAITRNKSEQVEMLNKTQFDSNASDKKFKSVNITRSQVPQSQTRNLSFKRNEDSNTMYVEITNEDDEVIRTIPADEKDPRFIELVTQSTPGMIIDSKS